MASKPPLVPRVFKTAWFAKAAAKARIQDAEICDVARKAMAGQVVALGGGVFKTRLNDNMHRSIILAKAGQFWIFEYLFAKKDRENIGEDELDAFKLLARKYASIDADQLSKLIDQNHLLEICHAS